MVAGVVVAGSVVTGRVEAGVVVTGLVVTGGAVIAAGRGAAGREGCSSICGRLGALLTGVFATKAINPIMHDAAGNALSIGLIEGNFRQLMNQAIAVVIAWALAIVGTLIILKVVDLTIGLRVSPEHEVQGLDLSQHGEEGYSWEATTM